MSEKTPKGNDANNALEKKQRINTVLLQASGEVERLGVVLDGLAQKIEGELSTRGSVQQGAQHDRVKAKKALPFKLIVGDIERAIEGQRQALRGIRPDIMKDSEEEGRFFGKNLALDELAWHCNESDLNINSWLAKEVTEQGAQQDVIPERRSAIKIPIMKWLQGDDIRIGDRVVSPDNTVRTVLHVKNGIITFKRKGFDGVLKKYERPTTEQVSIEKARRHAEGIDHIERDEE